jgi:hypothetical protein
MEILKFEDAPQRPTRARSSSRKSSSSKTIVGLAAAAVIAVVGSTLAANITLASGSSEFGQGVAQATACDDAITVTPAATFANVSNGGGFNFSSVALAGIKNACAGKTFKLSAYGDSNNTPVNIATVGSTVYSSATFVWATTAATALSVSPAISTSGWSGTTDAGAVTVTFNGTQATSGAVYKITLETN